MFISKKTLQDITIWFLPQSLHDLIRVITDFLRLATAGLKRLQEPDNLYEVLSYEARLELLDKDGRIAIYEKHERVRFLKDCSTGFYDYGWGDGQAFSSHRVSPGRIVDREALGPRHRSLIVLPTSKRRGETFGFSVRRRIEDGFREPGEWWLEAEVYHRTVRLALAVVLPSARLARQAWVVTQRGGRKEVIPVNRRQSDGRQALRFSVRQPEIGERFTLGWEW